MRKLTSIAAILVSIFFVSSCARIKVYRTSTAAPAMAPKEEVVPVLGFGYLTMKRPTVLSQLCPQGWQELATDVRGIQKLYRIVTLGFYSPWIQEVSCVQIATKKEQDDF